MQKTKSAVKGRRESTESVAVTIPPNIRFLYPFRINWTCWTCWIPSLSWANLKSHKDLKENQEHQQSHGFFRMLGSGYWVRLGSPLDGGGKIWSDLWSARRVPFMLLARLSLLHLTGTSGYVASTPWSPCAWLADRLMASLLAHDCARKHLEEYSSFDLFVFKKIS